MIEPIHLRPTAALAERVLLPGDPGRALALAQALLEQPQMFNHNRGLWGYSGAALIDGEPLTIQSSGIGGPSAAIVCEELIALGARRIVRVGTCGALAEHGFALGEHGLALGEPLVARAALCRDGTSRALGAGPRALAAAALSDALEQSAAAEGGADARPRAGLVASVDLFYGRAEAAGADGVAELADAGALAVEMEAATLFTLGALRGVEVGCVLAVSDLLARDGGRERIEADALLAAGERIGRIAAVALTTSRAPRVAPAPAGPTTPRD